MSSPSLSFSSYDAAGNRARMRRECRGAEFENAYYSYAADNSLRKLYRRLPCVQTTYYTYDLKGALGRQIVGAPPANGTRRTQPHLAAAATSAHSASSLASRSTCPMIASFWPASQVLARRVYQYLMKTSPRSSR